jgi:hypothetical protein
MLVMASFVLLLLPPPLLCTSKILQEKIYTPDQITELMSVSDCVVAATPYTPATDKLVSAAAIAAMKPNGVFINVGRGKCVDEEALIKGAVMGTQHTSTSLRSLEQMDTYLRHRVATECITTSSWTGIVGCCSANHSCGTTGGIQNSQFVPACTSGATDQWQIT